MSSLRKAHRSRVFAFQMFIHYPLNHEQMGPTIGDTVDGKNPKQPPGMYETLKIMGTTTYQLVQDFFHQPYLIFGVEYWWYGGDGFWSKGWKSPPKIHPKRPAIPEAWRLGFKFWRVQMTSSQVWVRMMMGKSTYRIILVGTIIIP